jgi:hypothetical protein
MLGSCLLPWWRSWLKCCEVAWMDKWTEILELVMTLEECRKKLVEILQGLEFEQDFHDNTPFHYGGHENFYIEVFGGRLYVSTLHRRTDRRYRMVVWNLDLHTINSLCGISLNATRTYSTFIATTAKQLTINSLCGISLNATSKNKNPKIRGGKPTTINSLCGISLNAT